MHRIYLSLNERMTPRMSLAPSSLIHEARRKWFAAFKQCNMHALRTLVYPEAGGGGGEEGDDFEECLGKIRGAGLPMPKSPSQQMISQMQQNHQNHGYQHGFGQAQGQIGQERDVVNGEREERGWWALRFQMMMKEMRRAQVVGGSGVSGGRLGVSVENSGNTGTTSKEKRVKGKMSTSHLPVPGPGTRRGSSVSPSGSGPSRRKGVS